MAIPRRVSRSNTQATTGFGVMGYFFLITRPEANKYPVNTSFDPAGHWDYQSTLRPRNTAASGAVYFFRPNVASDTEIAGDAILSTLPPAPFNFGNVIGGAQGVMNSSHLYKKVPDGANILFLDGHVTFRTIKYTAGSTVTPRPPSLTPRVKIASPGPSFWW